ncbi:hypothetical protein AB0O70_15445 [Microbacterium paraoxydans]|uniref:hypothetical protein n=1 Tax=Microbacterium paraoxydans TaxID=199592 RepID=UPI00342190F9
MTSEQIQSEPAEVPTPADVASRIAPRKLTQEQIDREVTRALRDAEPGLKPADYDEVKASAERADVLTRRIAEMEKEVADARLESLRVSVAARFGLSEEDRDVLLTGTDEATLVLQAERLARSTKPMGNVARREGGTVQKFNNRADREMREFVNDLFGNDPYSV